MRFLAHYSDEFGKRDINIDGDDINTRNHDVIYRQTMKVEDIAKQGQLISGGRELAFRTRQNNERGSAFAYSCLSWNAR